MKTQTVRSRRVVQLWQQTIMQIVILYRTQVASSAAKKLWTGKTMESAREWPTNPLLGRKINSNAKKSDAAKVKTTILHTYTHTQTESCVSHTRTTALLKKND